MFKLIEDLPPDVLAIEATGKVTHEDYQNFLIPKAEAMMAKGPVKLLYVAGEGFDGYELEALWDDSAFGREALARFCPYRGGCGSDLAASGRHDVQALLPMRGPALQTRRPGCGKGLDYVNRKDERVIARLEFS